MMMSRRHCRSTLLSLSSSAPFTHNATSSTSRLGLKGNRLLPSATTTTTYRQKSAPAPCLSSKPLGVTTQEELEKRIDAIMKLAQEAQLCIKDCGESLETPEYFEEEFQSAKVAVDKTGVAFSELLEELALTDKGVEVLNEVRRVYAPEVESLRQELKSIGKKGKESEEKEKS